MTREDMWEEFESQLIREVRTPITMSYNDSIRVAERGIKEVVKRWKKRLEQEPKADSWSIKDVADTFKKHGLIREQEPSGDLISRQVVLDTIHRFFTEEVDKIPTKKTEDGEVLVIHKCQPLFAMNKAICRRIKALQAVNPQEPKWISVSERLPKSCGMYIVTRKIYDCPDTAPIIMSDESWFDGQNTWHNDNRINHKRGYLSDVIAWMPLPEPYKAESDNCN